MEVLELINKVRENDSVSYDILLNRYNKMIYSIVNEYVIEYGNYKISKEDLYQEGCIGLYEACMTYKEDKKTKFSTYAYLIIRRKVIHFFKLSMNNYTKEVYSIDAIDCLDHYKEIENICVADNSVTYECLDELRRKSFKNTTRINDEERNILLLRLENYSYEEIAKKLNISKKRIDNRLTRLRRKYLKNDN